MLSLRIQSPQYSYLSYGRAGPGLKPIPVDAVIRYEYICAATCGREGSSVELCVQRAQAEIPCPRALALAARRVQLWSPGRHAVSYFVLPDARSRRCLLDRPLV